MIVYLDTSAFVKLVLREPGDAEVRSWFTSARFAASSAITYPESCAAIGRRSRAQGTDASSLTTWLEQLEVSWRRTIVVPVFERRAGEVALAHRLRGMDAVHLAAALALRERLDVEASGERVAFAAFDRRLLEAAEREGFATLGGQLD